jgi:hypothetical protein
MFPRIEDYLSAEPLDLDRLRHEIVAGPSHAPAFRAQRDLQQHFDMLEAEFVGQIRLKLVHAQLIVLIRRQQQTAFVYDHFCRLWADHGDLLLEVLDSRWLVSALDTICDLSPDPAERQVAILCVLFVNTLKLAETERLITEPAAPDINRIVGRAPIHDGLTAFKCGRGNMVMNLLQRIDRTLTADSRVGRIGREVISRALSADTVFARLAAFQTHNIWPRWLQRPPQPLAAPPVCGRGHSAPDGPGYILLNDTGRRSGGAHIGTLHACTALRRSLARRGLTELGWANDAAGFAAVMATAPQRPALVVLNEEGSLHHNARLAVDLLDICAQAKDQGLRVAVVNAVWQDNSDQMAAILRRADLLHLRDSLSRAALPPDVTAQITPDISIPLFLQTLGSTTEGPVTDLAVMDSVVPATSAALLDFAEEGALPFFAMPMGNLHRMRDSVVARGGPVWPRLLQSTDILAARGWLTGRFHGLLAALCAGRPVCALPSNTAKIEGFLRDHGLADACLLGDDWLAAPRAKQRRILERRLEAQRNPGFIRRRQAALTSAATRVEAMFDALSALAR